MKAALAGMLRGIGPALLGLLREFGLPLLAGLLVAGGTWWLTETLREHEGIETIRTMDTEARLVSSEFARAIANRSRRIERLAAAWHSRPADEVRFRADVEALVQQDGGFRAVEWLGPTLEPRWSAPRTATLPGGALEPGDDAARRRELEPLGTLESPMVTASVALGDAHRELMFVAPIRGGDSTAGTLVGVMRLRDLIDTVVEPELRRGFSVTVYEGPFQVFGPVWAQSGDQGQWARDAVSRVDLLELRVQVWPSEELAERMKSTAPMAVLILGYLLALIVTVIAYVLLPPIGGRRAAGPAGEEAAGMAALAAGAETGGEDPAPAPAGDPERPSA